ncbi:MAG: hypothetical protein L6427_00615 [Actinomycetia bacterium]|nr:hypothetical protein [Actinomycetes bacterium]
MAGTRLTNDENSSGRPALPHDPAGPIIRDIFLAATVFYLLLSFLDVISKGFVRYFLSPNILAAAFLFFSGFVLLTYTDKVGMELEDSQAGEVTMCESLLILGLVLSVVALVSFLAMGSGRMNLFLFIGMGFIIIVLAMLTEDG